MLSEVLAARLRKQNEWNTICDRFEAGIDAIYFSLSLPQCDQMIILLVQYLNIYNNENLPNIINLLPKWVHNLAKN